MFAWRSSRLFAFVLLLVALVIGGWLRFHRLARINMNGDEGASWIAASASSVKQVARIEHEIDPGKFALYDVMLHEWITVFGGSLYTMRAMSATLGMIAMVLLFGATREVWHSLTDVADGHVPGPAGELAGAFAALLYAINLTMVVSDRTMRMYPLTMCAELLQIIFFVRAQRRGGILNYGGVAIFTATMFAANFSSIFLLATEGLWLGWLLLRKLWDEPSRRLAVFRPSCAVAAGIAILLPSLPGAIVSSQGAMKVGAYEWLKLQPISWPYTTLRDSTGNSTIFWILMALAAFGVWRKWHSGRIVAQFLAGWAIGPLLAVMAVSYFIHPLEYPRYVLISFVGMFAFASLGAAALRSAVLVIALTVLLICLAVGPVDYQLRHPYEAAWQDATLLASRLTSRGQQIAVLPPYCVDVVRFYMPAQRRAGVVPMDDQCAQAPVLILSGREITPLKTVEAAEACYPRVIAKLKLVEVRAR